ncbi:dihydrodipicolinate synthase family protein [Acidianus manzaensis]|uniref:Dihydrodipicolinate synthase family protein n=1 Tax=Acidianus manzaensis TaxID=282676 RepID=A0A1W6JYQ4_9CREN|nr:dihydrodipicolinate synthase family protein [Acidianus manzaensis]ARM75451.1 dihydrodipicolinate synthase family protein [Acidianus manzaensis]
MKGVLTALTIPFRENKLAEDDLINHVNSLIKAEVNGFFLLGSVGQGTLLTAEERTRVLDIVKENIDNEKYIVVQIGGTDWNTILTTIKEAEKHEATALATIPPIYYKPDYETLRRYLEKITNLTSLPIYIYNIPRNVGFDVTPEITARLLHNGIKISGIKDTTQDITEIIGHISLGIDVFNGIDAMILPSLIVGGKGCVSGLSNAIPELIVSIYKNTIKGNIEEARKIQLQVYKLFQIVGKYPSPSIHYELVKLLRYDFGNVKEPLIRGLTEDEEKELKLQLDSLGFKTIL